jgi:hypothetical protein
MRASTADHDEATGGRAGKPASSVVIGSVARTARPAAARFATVALFLAPTLLAFFAGGYFAGPRRVALAVVWTLTAIAILVTPDSVNVLAWPPRLCALGGLSLLIAWTFLSATWATIPVRAIRYGEIASLYLGALVAATLFTRDARRRRAVEPALAAGAVLVIIYGLSERFLPGVLHFARTSFSLGRLEQPLTYWNAEGELAAIGLVLCVRIAGDDGRGRRLRMAAAASCCPLGAGLYLCFSRGALFAAGVGLLMLVVLAPQHEQLRAVLVCSAIAVVSALAVIPVSQMRWLEGSSASRERTGLLVLLLLLAISASAALAASALIMRRRSGDLGISRRVRMIPPTVVAVALIAFIAVGTARGSPARAGTGASHLITTNSVRYAYWRVAVHAFAAQPIRGVGAGGWNIRWHHEQPTAAPAQDAHSLPLQTLAELGLVGMGLLTAFLCGVALAGRDSLRVTPRVAPGLIAGCVVYLAHAPLDWDWEMPAVTLVAIILAGALLGGGQESET